MCGIVGIVTPNGTLDAESSARLEQAAASIRHRGPDEFGHWSDERACLCCNRLSIIDPQTGQQPIWNERRTVVVVTNGEIFNHVSLREALIRRGHSFRSRCDSEVLVHLYEDFGAALVDYIDGQFAFALWDLEKRCLLLARDRFGICPLHYSVLKGGLCFASEAKAILATGLIAPRLDPIGLAQVACLNTVIAPRTLFHGISQLPPAHYLLLDSQGLRIRRYWDLHFPTVDQRHNRRFGDWVAELSTRVQTAVKRTLISDVPIGTFLSGGIDSGIITMLASREVGSLPAYSIVSRHRRFDEFAGAERISRAAGTPLHTVTADETLIAQNFAKLVWHAESPVLSTEAAALLALAQRAGQDVKVILTGEGADEAFAGYLNFKQHMFLRRLNDGVAGGVRSISRRLMTRLFQDSFFVPPEERLSAIRDKVGFLPAQMYEYEFFRGLVPLIFDDHHCRAILASPLWADLDLSPELVADRHWLDQSLYLGYRLMLSNYLLGPHGDRVLMAHSVEGRYPFLDRELVEFAASIPPEFKLRRMKEKYVLRAAAVSWLPRESVDAPKRRFMAPFGTPFLHPEAPVEIRELLSEQQLREFGYFDPVRITRLRDALTAADGRRGLRSDLDRLRLGCAMTLVVSTQLFHHLFIKRSGFRTPIKAWTAPIR